MNGRYTSLFLGALMVVACGCATFRKQVGWETGPSGSEGAASESRLVRDGFAVLEFRAVRDEYQRVHVIGEVKNVSAAARGVELQATLRDTRGRLLAVGHFYPASNRNILPGEVWPFTYSFGRCDEGIRAELRIVGGFRTIETLSTASLMP
jgi:hypothetical protein